MKNKKTKEEKEKHEGGASLDDAFGDDEDVEYAKPKPRKENKNKKGEDEEELEEELDEIQNSASQGVERGNVGVKQSKPVSKIKIDGRVYEVDAHYLLMDHGNTKEMAVEVFDPQTDREFQLRYFSDQVEATIDLYELQEILYIKRAFKKVEW